MATRRIVFTPSAFRTPIRTPIRTPPRAISRSYSSQLWPPKVQLEYDQHNPRDANRSRRDSPIIFMHGLFGSKNNNKTVSKDLARILNRHVYTVDLRNHGQTGHLPQHTYRAMAGDVLGFIEERKLNNPTLIGHSMGAKVAMTLALSEPDVVRDIVAVDNAPVDTSLGSSFARYIEGMRRIEKANVRYRTEADEILSEYEKDVAIRQFLLTNLYRPKQPQGFTPVLKFRIPVADLGQALGHMGDFPFKDPSKARFEKPALFVRGTKSTYVPDEVLPVIGQFFPRFQVVNIDAGHWLIHEKPKEFVDAVTDFLTQDE
ncbi:alpha/beta-hydrolase [Whalleya microplaca]|nr:alpha/beta-hydrolase [Whalleya microplaca]